MTVNPNANTLENPEARLAANQTVLISNGGSRFHLPRLDELEPVCPTSCDESKGWRDKEYRIVEGFVEPCQICLGVLDETPSVCDLDDEHQYKSAFHE